MLCFECTETQATQSSKEKVLFRGRGCCDEVLFVIEYMYHIYLSKQWGAFFFCIQHGTQYFPLLFKNSKNTKRNITKGSFEVCFPLLCQKMSK